MKIAAFSFSLVVDQLLGLLFPEPVLLEVVELPLPLELPLLEPLPLEPVPLEPLPLEPLPLPLSGLELPLLPPSSVRRFSVG
jgi:hypothetical protein